jgi:serine/threonine-protein kinase HipA
MEDMAQLTERMTEQKYLGGYEQVLRAIVSYSVNPGLDTLRFFEILVFSFLTGNSDMHLKNFSLINQPKLGYVLSAAYDLVPAAIVLPDDKEEMALHLNGKKHKLSRKDFESLFARAQLLPQQNERIFEKMQEAIPTWRKQIANSFVTEANKKRFLALIEKRARRLGI